MSILQLIKSRVLNYLLYFFILIIIIIIWISYYQKFSFLQNFSPFLKEVSVVLKYPILSFIDINTSLFNLLTFIFTLLLWLSIWKYYQKLIYSIKKRNKNVSYGTITILANMGYYVIIGIVIIISLKIIWIDLSNFTMIVSALSVGIGFGLQTIVSNFISGIILMFEQSIKTWDYIELWNDLRWNVKEINMRSTTIRTSNNIDIIVPNQSFVQNNIINWTRWDNKNRLQIPFWVAYWTTFEKVEEVILWTLLESDLDFIKTEKLFPSIAMVSMSSNSVDFLLNVWIEWDESKTPVSTRWLFLRLVYKALNENNITIPFPQTDLHIKDSIPLEIRLISSDK